MAKLSYYVKLRHNRKKHRKIEQHRYAVKRQTDDAKNAGIGRQFVRPTFNRWHYTKRVKY